MLEYNIEGSKGGEEKPHTPVETPNNLLSVAYAKVLLAVAEGELEGNPTGRDILLNGTPLVSPNGTENFGGVSYTWRNGSQDQSYIQGMPDVSSEYNVGVELKTDTPYVRAVTKTSLSAIRLTFQWPALLRQLQNGDTVGYTINYAIDISTDGGPYVEYQTYRVSGKTNSAYERTHRVDLPTATTGWTIRARRITPESTSSTVQDTMNIKSYAEVVDAKQRYPNTALLFVQFDSRLFGGGSIPKISVKTKGRIIRVPDNYDPVSRTYTGIWSGAFKWAYTNNPAWVFYDLVTQDRFGLGNRVTASQVDKFALYEVAQYCDVMVDDGSGSGNLEPRHTCNIYIQSQADAWKVLRDIASIFNGMTYWNGNQFVAIADKQEPIDNIPTFSRSNVINGIFNYQTTDERSIYTSALISYDEPLNHYGTEVEAVWEKSEILRWGGDRQTSISAIGCTSRGEAQRKGKYTLLTNMFNTSVTFQTGLQGLSQSVLPGSIIGVADPLVAGKPFTGRLVAGTPTVVTLDRTAEAVAGDKLYITKKDGKQEARTIQAVAGKVITVTTAYSETPAANAVWYLEAEDLKSQLFRVTKITAPDDGIFEITGVEYNDSKYAAIDTGARLEPRPISKVPAGGQEAPASVTITSATHIEQTMAVATMTVSYPQTPNAVLYEGQWKVGDGDWVTLGTTGAPEFNVRGIYTGTYIARVRAINAGNIKSIWTLSAATDLVGKTGAPPTLASLTVKPLVYGMQLNWAFKPGSEDTARTEIFYSTTTAFENAIKLGDFAYPQDTHEIHGLKAGTTFYFWARLYDRTGNVGEWYPLSSLNGVQGQSSSDAAEYEQYFIGQINESALGQDLFTEIEKISGTGPESVNGRIDAAKTDLESQIAGITDALVYDPTKAYTTGQIVRQGQYLYQAIADVPVGATPPNVLYWKDVGQILEEANGLAIQVNLNTVNIERIDGVVTSTASQLESLTAAYRDDDGEGELADALRGWDATASFAQEVKVRATENEATVTRLTTLDAKVASNTANISSLESVVVTNQSSTASQLNQLTTQVGDNKTAIETEATTRSTEDTALSNRITTTQAQVDNNTSRIQTVENVQVDANQSIATLTNTVQSVYTANRDDDGEGELSGALDAWQSKASFQSNISILTDSNQAVVKKTDTLEASLGETNAAVQTVSQAQAALDGKASALWSVKLQVNSQGQYVAAGIGLGIENGPAGLQSQFLVSADRFAVVNGTNTVTSAPFVVDGGQVFIRDAFIKDGTITNAKIGSFISSTDYVAGTSGWRLNKDGTLEINGSVSGQGRLTLTNRAVKVYDGAGTLRVQLGDLTA